VARGVKVRRGERVVERHAVELDLAGEHQVDCPAAGYPGLGLEDPKELRPLGLTIGHGTRDTRSPGEAQAALRLRARRPPTA